MSVRTAASACSRVGLAATGSGAARTWSDRAGCSAGDDLGQGFTTASIAVSPVDRPCGRGCHRAAASVIRALKGFDPCATTGRRIPILHGFDRRLRSRTEPAAAPSCSRRRAAPYIFLREERTIALPRHQPLSKLMLNEVYNSRILELAGNIPRLGRLDNPDATATAHSKLCGSTVTVDLKMGGDTVTDFSHH